MDLARGHEPGSSRRRAVGIAVVGALGASLLGAALTLTLGQLDLAPVCGRDGQALTLRDGSTSCVHTDEAPPGVDVSEPVATAVLRRRPGAGPAAYDAAEALGVPTAVASAATTPGVTCDGDGTSGYRVQVMYVVEAGDPNRYASLLPSFRLWAAGVDDVVNRSAALTGGVRHVRYVTTAGSGGGCVADVLNVTVPNGATASFGATINAVQALGYDDPTRKYLLETDATQLCGIANLYTNDRSDQGNPNNGAAPQYARVDAGCWGLGDGSGQHSVEAHELVHTLGAVLGSAPHATNAGHCWDESDTMCYSDGDPHPMVSVCPAQREYLLDCGSDDYFSTYPDPGGYLDAHWDAASSRFLLGGGDGTGGGSAGTPTVLGARLAVNNPAVPGLATQATVTPVLPAGRTVTKVAWDAGRNDCVFDTPDQVQTSVTCNAGSTSPTTVTATLTDSTGATKQVTSPLTFATSGALRPVSLSLSVAGQSSDDVDSASMCVSASTPVSAVLTDTATGQPVKGLTAAFTKQISTQAVASVAGNALSDVTGTATSMQLASRPTTYAARTAATAVYDAAAPVSLATTVEKCAPAITASASTLDLWLGDPVTVTGTLTRTVGDRDDVPVGGAIVPVTQYVTTTSSTGRTTSRVTRLASPKTALDGSFSVVVKPTGTGGLAVGLPASASYVAAPAYLGDMTVHTPTSTLDAGVASTDVGYGAPVVVTGTLHRVAQSTTPVAGAPVTLKVQAPGARYAVVVGSGKTLADGTFTVSAPLKVSGALRVVYAGTSTLPGVTTELGDATAGTWGTALTATPALSSVAPSTSVVVTGTLSRSYGGASEPARSVPVKIYARAAGSSTDVVTTAATTATGTFKTVVRPKVTTTYTVRVVGVAHYDDAAATAFTVAVR